MASYGELCEYQEYQDGLENRLQEHELSVSGLYVVMFSFKSEYSKASKFYSRVDSVTQHNDQSMLNLSFLDDDLQPLPVRIATDIQNGILNGSGTGMNRQVFTKANDRQYQLYEGYLKDYDQPGSDEEELQKMMEAMQEQLVPVRPLKG